MWAVLGVTSASKESPGGSSGEEPGHRRPLASFKADRRGSWL
jgi:hypothetical protein